jgi:hypothetical protein
MNFILFSKFYRKLILKKINFFFNDFNLDTYKAFNSEEISNSTANFSDNAAFTPTIESNQTININPSFGNDENLNSSTLNKNNNSLIGIDFSGLNF